MAIGEISSSSSSGFDFIKPLQGSKKGDKVEGLYNVKKYLERFGYINDLPYDINSPRADYFSDQLESAIRTYQTNFHLNSTGVLDAATVSQMTKPRCGAPDITNGTNWMRRRMAPNYAFFPGMPRWPEYKRVLKYGFAGGTPPKFFGPVRKAFEEWHTLGRFSFRRSNFRKADLTFELVARDHGDGHPFDGPGGVSAHSFAPRSGVCHFDSEENWVSYGPPPNGLDIQSIALHEIGHLLGLEHTDIRSAVMWPHLELGEKKRELQADDIQGFWATMAPKVSPLLSYAFLFLSLVLLRSKLAETAEVPPSPSPSPFIKQLQGSKKGDKVEGLYNIKKYLKTFGYIDHLSDNSSETEYFSDQLESAVKTYQTNFNLNATGVLDAATVSAMMMPRCGAPDIINGTNWMQRRRRVAPQYAFFPGSPKWPRYKHALAYGFADRTPDKFFLPVKLAFADWHMVSHFSFRKTKFNKADVTFQLFSGDHGDGKPFDGRGGVYAHAFAPTRGICHFDADENWAEFGPPHDAVDIRSVALHEIGHLLGLGHSEVEQSVMWPRFAYGLSKINLHRDDIEGIRALYPD
nr:metalloendoproteinase 2-MMP-like [Ipomoea batatas]